MNILCPLPFVHPYYDVRGIYRACCNGSNDEFGEHISEVSMTDWFYGPKMEKLRQDMLHGNRNPLCNTCWKNDDAGIVSERINQLKIWKNKNVDYENPKPRYFNLQPSNHCNLACIFCTASSSDKIVRITEELPKDERPQRWHDSLNFFKQTEKKGYFDLGNINYIIENISDMEILKFTGGEPFLSNGVLDILKTVAELKPTIDIRITSNGTVIRKEFYPILKKLKNISIKLSIDAVDDLYSYIRFPSVWKSFNVRLQKNLKNLPNVLFNVNCLITNMNIEQIPKIRNWFIGLNKIYPNLDYFIYDPYLTPNQNESSLYQMDIESLIAIKEKLIKETADWNMENETDKQIYKIIKKIDDSILNNLFNFDTVSIEFKRQNKIRNMSIVDCVEPITKKFFTKLLHNE